MHYSPSHTPSMLQYSSLIQRAIPAHVDTRLYQPVNGSIFSPESGTKQIRIGLALPHMTFLDARNSFLQFKLTVSGTANASDITGCTIDGSIASIIDTLSIIGPDGTVLSRLDNYAQISAALKSVQGDFHHNESFGALTDGSAPDGVARNATSMELATATASVDAHFCIPLLSGILSASHYLPLGFLSGSPLSILIDLNPFNTAFANPSHSVSGHSVSAIVAPTYSISEVAYNASVVTLNSSESELFQNMIQSLGGVQLHCLEVQSVGVNNLPISTNPTPVSFSMPVRSRSLRLLVHLMHQITDQTSANTYGVTTRRCRQISQYQHKISGQAIPSAPIQVSETNTGQAIMEILRAIASVGDQKQSCLLTNSTGAEDNDVGSVGALGFYGGQDSSDHDRGCAFLIAQNMQAFVSDQGLESGTDLSSVLGNVILEMHLTPSNRATIVRSYAISDSIVTFTSDGVVSVSM